MIKTWIKRALPNKTFEKHFEVDHTFHGVVQYHINETYMIRPKSNLGVQLLFDGLQISDQSLHLKAKISIQTDCIKLCLQVVDPNESHFVLQRMKKIMVSQLLNFEKRFYSNPVVLYVEQFCNQCVHYGTKPLNQCISKCQFHAKDKS